MAFTLVTPWLDDMALTDMAALLRGLPDSRGLEVVVNDWGLLRLIRREGIPVEPVLGRLLVRGGPVANAAGGGAGIIPAGNLDAPGFLELLTSLGVRRVETDGLAPPPSVRVAGGPVLTRHLGVSFVTLTRRCPWRFDGSRWETGPCSRPCLSGLFTLAREDGLAVIHDGNAQFVRTGDPDMTGGGFDRVVFHPVVVEEEP
jgi:hypothetical protein